jgi:hypothetical protein
VTSWAHDATLLGRGRFWRARLLSHVAPEVKATTSTTTKALTTTSLAAEPTGSKAPPPRAGAPTKFADAPSPPSSPEATPPPPRRRSRPRRGAFPLRPEESGTGGQFSNLPGCARIRPFLSPAAYRLYKVFPVYLSYLVADYRRNPSRPPLDVATRSASAEPRDRRIYCFLFFSFQTGVLFLADALPEVSSGLDFGELFLSPNVQQHAYIWHPELPIYYKL